MMAKQKGSKPRAVIGTHHGLMHGAQSHQQFYRQRNNTNISPKGSARSSFSTFSTSNTFDVLAASSGSPKTSSSSNLSSLIGHGPCKLTLHSPLTSSSSSSSEVISTSTKVNPNRLKRHYSFSHSTTAVGGSRSKNHNTDPESMVRRLA